MSLLILFFFVGSQTAFLPWQYTETTQARIERILTEFPVIDGHNDFPMGIRELLRNDISKLDFDSDLTIVEPWASYWANHIDLPRMRKGQMGGQFWSAFIGCSAQFHDAVQLFLEQIDVIHQLVARYPEDLHWATSVADIEAARAQGKIASLIGVESGHAIGSSLPLVRALYRMGARYMTLTHGCNTPWADAAQVEVGDFPPRVGGLSEFGEKVVREMNRLGMLVDLSHVSSDAMRQALAVTRAPVIFSHSGARAICSYPRNVPEDVSHYPEVFAALIEDGTYDWTDEELAMLASQNLINTFRAVEEVRDLLASEGEQPDNSWIPEVDLGLDTGCNSDFPPKP